MSVIQILLILFGMLIEASVELIIHHWSGLMYVTLLLLLAQY